MEVACTMLSRAAAMVRNTRAPEGQAWPYNFWWVGVREQEVAFTAF